MKKSKILLIMALIVVTLTSIFSGCDFINNNHSQSSVDELSQLKAKVIFTWSEDESVKYELYPTINSMPKKNIPGKPSGYYKASYEIYKNDEIIASAPIFHEFSVAPGEEYLVSVPYRDSNNTRWSFYITVIIDEYRVTPTLVIDPASAIEYTENERYVYKYTGENCLPEVLYCMHDGEILHITESRKYLNNDERIYSLIEVGVYELRYCVVASAYVDEKYQQICAPINVYITVEIIE